VSFERALKASGGGEVAYLRTEIWALENPKTILSFLESKNTNTKVRAHMYDRALRDS